MQTRRYETLILTVPEVTQDEIHSMQKELDVVVKNAKGTVLSFDRWGKYKLAYPVRKNDYGVFFLMRYEVPEIEAIKNIRTLLAVRLNEVVMRFLQTALDPKSSLTYQRPKSLEEASSEGEIVSKEKQFRDFMPDKESDLMQNNDLEVEE